MFGFQRPVLIHEIGHIIGLFHEQSRPDRDTFVEILWDNIKENQMTNFNKHSRAKINTFQVKYDYSSIMHYGPTVSMIYIVILISEATFCLLYIIVRNNI